jgi:hypothetical protein
MDSAQEILSQIAQLQDRLRIARNGLASLNRNLQSNQAIIARYTEEVATIPGQVLALQAQLRAVQSPASSGDIVNNANQARDNNANSTLPPQPGQVLTPAGRITIEGANNNGAGTNANETPTQQNNPTVGTDATTKPIGETQAVNNQSGQLVPAPTSLSTQASVRAIDNAIAATGGPGAGAGADAGAGAARINSPFPKYQARNQSLVYQATQVVSVFKQGRFEQTLHGVLYTQLTGNTTQTNTQQRVDPTTIEGYGVNEMGRTKTQQARPATTQQIVSQLPMKQQAAIAAGTDPNTVNDQGMAFGGGGL